MRSGATVATAGLCGVWLTLGCGETSSDHQTGGSAGQAAGAASGGTSSGGSATGGSATGGSATGGSATGGRATGGSATDGGEAGTSATGGATGLVDCDPRKVLCRVATPECPLGEVPSVEGSCYGDCVKIDRCSCSSAEQCPDPDRYTCLLGPKHCSFYLK